MEPMWGLDLGHSPLMWTEMHF